MKLSKRLLPAACALLAVTLAGSAPGQDEADTGPAPPDRAPYHFESSGQARIGGARLRYQALVEETFIEDSDGEKTASLVAISYLLQDQKQADRRPVVFVFNGGPGSASLWLHMGLLGPKRVAFDDAVHPATTPPFALAENADSILDVADIVLFDPPGTGFSRVLPAGQPDQFYGVNQDADITVQFIETWVRRHGRWNSPRFLLCESYGTIRAAVVAKKLAGGPMETGSMQGLTLNGVILLGQAMGSDSGDAEFANDLSSLAATAWYHGRVDRDATTLAEQVAHAQSFASRDYILALYAGSALPESERRQVAQTLSGLTGLPLDFILANDLRVSTREFSKELLKDQGLQTGLYDSRFTLPLASSGNDPVADDPAMGQYVPGFVAAQNSYLHDELGVDIDEPYLAIEFRKVNFRWDYGSGPGIPSRRNFADDLAVAMRRNPALRLFVGSGWYDLVTTTGAALYTVSHSDFPPGRVEIHNYASGHMPYLGDESRAQLAGDLRSFIRAATQP